MANADLVAQLRKWRDDPDLFDRQVFGVTPEPWQSLASRALIDHDRLSIRSGHGVGKSAWLSWRCIWFLLTHPHAKIPVTAPTAHQLEDVLWTELRKWLERVPAPLKARFDLTSDRLALGDSFAVARTARKEKPEALQGFHADNLLFLIDEAAGVDQIIFETAEGALSTEGAKVLMCSNPTRVSGYFHDSHHGMRHRWHTMRVESGESSQVSQTYLDDMAAKYGVESDIYRVRVLGEFPTSDTDAAIPLPLIEAAYTRDVEPIRTIMPVWGLDVARYGSCRTALVKRWGNHQIEAKTWRKRDTMEVAGIVMREYEDTPSDMRPATILVDAIGLGAGVADRLRELDLPAVGINVGEAPSSGRFLNLRAELWCRAREWLEERDTRLESQELGAELSIVKQKFTSSGKMQIEGKEQMMERGVDSPDLADAFVLTFAGADRRKEHTRYDRYVRKQPESAWTM